MIVIDVHEEILKAKKENESLENAVHFTREMSKLNKMNLSVETLSQSLDSTKTDFAQ